jgi:hypothetical protein
MNSVLQTLRHRLNAGHFIVPLTDNRLQPRDLTLRRLPRLLLPPQLLLQLQQHSSRENITCQRNKEAVHGEIRNALSRRAITRRRATHTMRANEAVGTGRLTS